MNIETPYLVSREEDGGSVHSSLYVRGTFDLGLGSMAAPAVPALPPAYDALPPRNRRGEDAPAYETLFPTGSEQC